MDGFETGWLLPLAGLAAGSAMGFFARRYHFCTMSALERHWYAGDSDGLRSWVLAATIALIVTQALLFTGAMDLSASFYLSPLFGWTGAIAGGLAFGFGMALVGTCGFGAIVRLGGGSLRSLIVLAMLGLSALATQKGLLAQMRIIFVDDLALNLSAFGDQSLPSLMHGATGANMRPLLTIIIASAALIWIFRDASFRANRGKILAGTVIGLGVAFGWIATSALAGKLFAPVQVEAASFVVPVGDTIMQLITFTGELPDYGVGLVCGVLLGAALAARLADDVRWEACDDARELSRHLMGALLMGTGGVMALGCTIGQGISAVSVMAVSAPVVMISIAVGARLGLAYLLEGSVRYAFRGNLSERAG